MSKSKIIVNRVAVNAGDISYDFSCEGAVAEVFVGRERLTISYSEDISQTPSGIAVIPLVTNLLPIVWVYDAELVVPELDKDFYDNIPGIKQGFIGMYPKVSFGGHITAKQLVAHTAPGKQRQTALFFSGGVDATSSLITMLKAGDTPRLMTLWGADVALDDVAGWQEKATHTKTVAAQCGLDHSFITTTFRTFLCESVLDNKVQAQAGDMWWHGFQHGIGIIGHGAPLVYKYQLHELHIAATFVEGNIAPCASDPTIDEHVVIAGCRTVHNGYDMTRQRKAENICRFINERNIERLPIKVCWMSRGAKNCGHCEKCMRTACEFLAEGADLRRYAMEQFDGNFARNFVEKEFWMTENLRADWTGAQARLRELRPTPPRPQDDINWLLNIDFAKLNTGFRKRYKRSVFVANQWLHKVTPRSLKQVLKKVMDR